MIRNRRWASLIALLCSFTLIAAACGDDDDAATTDDTSTTAGDDSTDTTAGGDSSGGSLAGTIEVSGSSTVAPITTRVAELWADVESGVTTNVDGPGTGDGFELFCNGETDISDASRPIKGEEVENCEANGIEFIELKVGIDGLSIITAEDTEIECLNFADLYALTGPESSGFSNWTDAQDIATELGSATEMPDASLTVVGPGEESGTYDSYVELVIEEFNEDRDAEAETRPDYQSSADDNVILQGVGGAQNSLGWVGYAFASEATGIKQVPVADGTGTDCVEPTPETISSGEYPIARDLYIYVNAEKAESNEALAAFIDFFLSDDGIGAVSEVGYVDLADDDLDATRDVWEARETVSRDGGS